MTQQFQIAIPDEFLEQSGTREWATYLHNFLDDLTRQNGSIDTIGTTEVIVLSQAEKLALMTVTASVNLDTVKADSEANKTSLASLLDALPAYTISNDATDRVYDANAAAGAISATPTQAEVENLRDAVLEIADVLATVIGDLVNKNVLGT